MDCEEKEEPQPSTSKEQDKSTDTKLNNDKELCKTLDIEEILMKSKTYMLDYEKHMFMDTIDADCLVVSAKYVKQSKI